LPVGKKVKDELRQLEKVEVVTVEYGVNKTYAI
jgi:hypothetical protein